MVLVKNNVRDEESNIDARKVVSFTFQYCNIYVVVDNLVSESSLFVGDELSRYPLHNKRNQEIN